MGPSPCCSARSSASWPSSDSTANPIDPNELEREGPGLGGGDTREVIMFNEFILWSYRGPWEMRGSVVEREGKGDDADGIRFCCSFGVSPRGCDANDDAVKTTSRNTDAKQKSMRAGANAVGTSEWKPRELCRFLAWAGEVSLMKRLRNTPNRICSPGEKV